MTAPVHPAKKHPPGPPDGAWDARDPLGETLHTLRMSGVVYAHSQLSAPWGVDLPPMPDCLLFHVVTAGHCFLKVEGENAIEMRPGQFVLVPHGLGHAIFDHESSLREDFFNLPIERPSPRYERIHYGGGGAGTTLVCGAVRFKHPAARELVRLLPRILQVEAWSSPHADWMHATLRLMAAEAAAQQPGGETIVTRLADILVIQAIRTWLAEDPMARTGWLGALHDERIGRALVRIHRDPSYEWTVASMAEAASMSRSAFSARFSELVGESPAHYLTRWRMHLAGSWMREQRMSASACAGRLGYESLAAFHRAFKRVMGVPPGRWLRTQAEV